VQALGLAWPATSQGRDCARPGHICTGTALAPATSAPGLGLTPARICTGTVLTPATSALGLGSPLPHLHRDWAHPCHICPGTGLAAATSAPGLGPPLPHPRWEWGPYRRRPRSPRRAHRCHCPSACACASLSWPARPQRRRPPRRRAPRPRPAVRRSSRCPLALPPQHGLRSHSAATRRPHGGHTAATRRPHGGHTAATRRPHGGHTAATRRRRTADFGVGLGCFFFARCGARGGAHTAAAVRDGRSDGGRGAVQSPDVAHEALARCTEHE
jgi:hypothetical protein